MKSLLPRLAFRFTLIFLILLYSIFQPTTVSAQTTAAWEGECVANYVDEDGAAYQVATIQGARCLIANILSIAVSGLGVVGFCMFLIASFTYLLSGGNSKNTESSKNTFTFAVVGIVVALSAIIILRLISSFTGVNKILEFDIPSSQIDWGVDGAVPADGAGAP